MGKLAELRAKHSEIVEQLRTLNTEIGESEPTAEQQQRWDDLDAQERAAKEAAETEERAGRVRESRAKWRATEIGAPGSNVDVSSLRYASRRELVDTALRMTGDDALCGHLRDEQRQRLDKLLRVSNRDTDGSKIARLAIATCTDEYRSAFGKIMAGRELTLTSEERAAVLAVDETRTVMGLTDANGGYAVPVIVDPTIILTGQGSPNDILRLARVETITNDVWRGISSAGSTWAYKAEGAEFTAADPALGQPTVSTQICGGWVTYSFELEGDWPQLASELETILAAGYSELLAEKLTTGTSGSSEPIGVVTRLAATAGSCRELTTAATVGAVDIYDTWDALPARWRRDPSCAWMSSTDMQNSIRQLGTTDPNFTVNITEAGIARLFGREYPTNDFMADVPAGTGTQALLVVGAWQQFLVAQRAGMVIERVAHVIGTTAHIPTGQRGALAWARNGADAIVPGAFRLVTNRSA